MSATLGAHGDTTTVNVHGVHDLEAPRATVFEAIRDPRILMAVIPGCESVERVGPDEYEGILALRLPGVAGRYRTWVRLVDATPPERAGLDGRVEGAMGSIAGRADFTLAERDGGCRLEYRGVATIHGPLARLDSRFVERLADSLIAQGLRALDRHLAAEGPMVPSEGGTGAIASDIPVPAAARSTEVDE